MNTYIKKCYIFIALFSLLGCSSITAYKRKNEVKNVDFERTYRDYVLCRCMEFGFGNDSLFKNDLSTGIYNDITLFSMHFNGAKQRLDSLAKHRADSITHSQIADHEGRKAVMLECIDYYNSKKLKQEIKAIIKDNAKAYKNLPKNQKLENYPNTHIR